MADTEELIDYEDEHDAGISSGAIASNGSAAAAAAASSAPADGDKDKKGFVGIHSTGFRLVQGSFSSEISQLKRGPRILPETSS